MKKSINQRTQIPAIAKPVITFFMCALWWLVCMIPSDVMAIEKPSLDDYKALIIHRVVQLTRWPNEEGFDTLKIAVYGGSSSYIKNLNNNYKNRNIRDKKLHVLAFNPFTDEGNIHVLFINHEKIDELVKIVRTLRGKKVIIISDNSQDKRHVMVNLTHSKITPSIPVT